MKLDNHIAYRFLTDDSLAWEIVETTYPNDWEELMKAPSGNLPKKPALSQFYQFVNYKDQKTLYITNTVFDKLDMLKISKRDGKYDWTVFRNLPNQKITFILPNNRVLRMRISDTLIEFIHLIMNVDKTKHNFGNLAWAMFYVDRLTGEQCDHFEHIDVKQIETFVYTLLCFIYLTDNDEVILKPGAKHGTRKEGKIINELPFSMTIVNSRWNTDVMLPNEFGVRGHFAIRWSGTGRTQAKIVFIEPFKKSGYSRKSGKSLNFDNVKIIPVTEASFDGNMYKVNLDL